MLKQIPGLYMYHISSLKWPQPNILATILNVILGFYDHFRGSLRSRLENKISFYSHNGYNGNEVFYLSLGDKCLHTSKIRYGF